MLIVSTLLFLVFLVPSTQVRAAGPNPPDSNRWFKDFAVIRKGVTWHIFAIYCQVGNSNCLVPYLGLKHMTSTDLYTWTDAGFVIPPGGENGGSGYHDGNWDDEQIWAPSIVEQNGTYYMYYTGTNSAGRQKIGLATSTDLYNWTKYPGNPVLDCSSSEFYHGGSHRNPPSDNTDPAPFDNYLQSDPGPQWTFWDPAHNNTNCRDPNVQWDDAGQQWVMTFSGVIDEDDTGSPYWGGGSADPAIIGIATSTDLVTWHSVGPILSTRGYTNSESPHVFEHGGKFYMIMTDNGGSLWDGFCKIGRSGSGCNTGTAPGLVFFQSDNRFTGWTPTDWKHRIGVVSSPSPFASEYVNDRGTEYLFYDNPYSIAVKRLTWTGNPFSQTVNGVTQMFTLTDPAFKTVSGTIWNDANGDGTKAAAESAIAGVTVKLYVDDNNNTFVPSNDAVYASVTTNASGAYSIPNVLPGTYRVTIAPTDFGAGGVLAGKTVTTGTQYAAANVQSDTTVNFGVQSHATTWTFLTPGDYTVSSGAAVINGYGGATVFTGTTETIRPTASTPFSTLQHLDASTVENGGTVRFVLSNDGGSTWKYWDGSAWTSSNGTISQANTGDQINTNAATFPEGGGQFLWRALLYAPASSNPAVLHVGIVTNLASNAPVVTGPINGTVDLDGLPVFQLTTSDSDADALTYELQLDTDPSFSSPALHTIDQAGDQFGWTGQEQVTGTRFASGAAATYTMPVKLPAGTWYWRARAIDPDGSNKYSGYTDVGTFIVPQSLTSSSFTISPIGASSARISWISSNSSIGSVEYGSTIAYGNSIQETTTSTNHGVTITGLTSNTVYHLRTRMTDLYGQTVTSGDYTFTIPQTVVSDITVTAITDTTATVNWTTNEPATSGVRFGRTVSYGATVTGTNYKTAHQLKITALKAGTTYHFSVTSVGNSTATSSDAVFTTPLTVPTISSTRTIANKTLLIVGSGMAGQTVRFYIDGRLVKQAKLAGTTGRKSFSVSIGIATFTKGRHVLTAKAVDSAGRTSALTSDKTFTKK